MAARGLAPDISADLLTDADRRGEPGVFPESIPLLQRQLPTLAFVREVFESASFRLLEAGVLTQTVAADHSAYADKLAAGGDSILAQLTASEFERGLGALRAFAASNPPAAVTEPIDYVLFEAIDANSE